MMNKPTLWHSARRWVIVIIMMVMVMIIKKFLGKKFVDKKFCVRNPHLKLFAEICIQK